MKDFFPSDTTQERERGGDQSWQPNVILVLPLYCKLQLLDHKTLRYVSLSLREIAQLGILYTVSLCLCITAKSISGILGMQKHSPHSLCFSNSRMLRITPVTIFSLCEASVV